MYRLYAYVWDYVKRLAYYYFFLEKFFLRNRARGTWCSVVSGRESEKGVGRLYVIPIPKNRLKSTGYLQSLKLVRVWYRA